jgi:hypothetical protein
MLRKALWGWLAMAGCFVAAYAMGIAQDDADDQSKRPKTAEEYLKIWKDQESDLALDGSELPADELNKVIEFLRKEYPFESLRQRLAFETKERLESLSNLHGDLKRKVKKPKESSRKSYMEEYRIEKTYDKGLRPDSLAQLHSDKAAEFFKQLGFGIGRIPYPGPERLRRSERSEIALETEYHSATEFSREKEIELGVGGGVPNQHDTANLHDAASSLFANAEDNGLIKSVDEVSGFERHAMTWMPRSENIGDQPEGDAAKTWWKINRLELVSLLRHDHFVVYESDKLPNMANSENAPTRKLDEFEAPALSRLFKGEDLVARATTNRIRMLGSLRAAKQCLECHSVKEGELLGAFSYELLRQPMVKNDAAQTRK